MSLYKYQETYLKDLPRSIIMAADVGLGKTRMALEHYARHSNNFLAENPDPNKFVKAPLLILAPASKAKTGDWEREIEAVFGEAHDIDYVVMSYDKFARDPKPYTIPGAVVIADECHFVANSQSNRGKAVQKAVKVAHQFIGLSATPLPNGWRSLENYAIMFGLVKNKTEFINTYVRIDRSRGFPIILGYNQEPKLKHFWNTISKPLDRDGNLDLPESISIPKDIRLDKTSAKAYAEIMASRMLGDEMLDSPSALFNALRQATTEARRDQLISILEGTDEHVVIFYNYNAERDMIHQVLNKHFKDREVYEQSGHISHLPERKDWGNLKPSVTLAQYQSASTAIELTYASVTIYLSPTYSYSNFHQSMGRTKRNGQTKRTVFYMLRVLGTVDNEIWKALKNKKDFNKDVWLEQMTGVQVEM